MIIRPIKKFEIKRKQLKTPHVLALNMDFWPQKGGCKHVSSRFFSRSKKCL